MRNKICFLEGEASTYIIWNIFVRNIFFTSQCIYVLLSLCMHVYLFHTLNYNPIILDLFCYLNCSRLAIGSFFSCFQYPFDISLSLGIFLGEGEHFYKFLALWEALCLFCIFLTPALVSASSPRSPGAWLYLLPLECHSFLGPFSGQSKKIHICLLNYVYKHH